MTSIRRATLADLDAIAPLFDAYRGFYGQASDPGRARDWLHERMQRNESVVLVAEDAAGVAVGFSQLYPMFSSVRTARTWILNDLFVAPEARGGGAARALMLAARQLGEDTGAAELFLQTAHDNLAAQRLCESLGWTLDEQFRVYTLDPRR